MADEDLKKQLDQIRKDVEKLGRDKAGRMIKNAAAYMLKVIQRYPLKSTRQDDPRRQATSALYRPARRENWVQYPDGTRSTVAEFFREKLGTKADKKGRLNGFQKSESNRRKVQTYKGRKARTIYTIGRSRNVGEMGAVMPTPVTYLRLSGKEKPRTWSGGQHGGTEYWLRKSWQYEVTRNGVRFQIRGRNLGGKSSSGFLHRLDQGGTFTLPERIVGYRAFIKTHHQGNVIHKEVLFYPQYTENPQRVHTAGYHIAENVIRIVKERFHLP